MKAMLLSECRRCGRRLLESEIVVIDSKVYEGNYVLYRFHHLRCPEKEETNQKRIDEEAKYLETEEVNQKK